MYVCGKCGKNMAYLRVNRFKSVSSAVVNMKKLISFVVAALPWCLLLLLYAIDPAFAQPVVAVSVDDMGENIVEASAELPAIITAAAYLAGLTLGVQGVIKLKNHVDNPQQTPIRVPAIRFLACGCLLAIQYLFDVYENVITGGAPDTAFDHDPFTFSNFISSVGGVAAAVLSLGNDVNTMMLQFVLGIQTLPGLITAIVYLFALSAGVMAILKLKDHVENPDQTPLRESIIRFIVAGCFFGFSYFLKVIVSTVTGGDGPGIFGGILDGLGSLGFFNSGYAGGLFNASAYCNPVGGIGANGGIGDVICGGVFHTLYGPAFLTALSYLIGLILAVWGIIKIRDHVLNPQQVKVTEGISRLLSSALFLCLPVAVAAVRSTITPIGSTVIGAVDAPITSWNEGSGTATCTGLDGSLACFMADMLAPMHIAINFFSFTIGTVLIMIGISRLMKTAQDGPKGPGGLGTFMTFVVGGTLMSYNEMVRAFTMTFFSDLQTRTYAKISYTKGMTTAEQDHVHIVISAILKFMIVVGLISFVRGLFIVRSVAEGNSQASMMAGVTHLAGGALAINLGGVINAVQETLGLTKFGVQFF